MKVYLVKRTDEVNYDEYDSCVVIAESVEQVEDIINRKVDYVYDIENRIGQSYWDMGNRTITEIDLSSNKHGIICSSYNAG